MERPFMSRDQLLEALDTYHSDEFVVMFLGYLMAHAHKSHGLELDQNMLLDAWQQFKTEMGKRGIRG